VEVDLIVETPQGKIFAIEIKSKPLPIYSDFRAGFAAMKALEPSAQCICCCTGDTVRIVEGYEVLPYEHVLVKIFE